jgi:carbon-monoxide dehydrogenase medium subunit
LNGDTCQSIRIGLTNVSSKPMRAANAEAALAGQPLTEDNIKAAGVAAAQACEPSSDLRGSEAYKRDLVRVITARAIHKAVERAKAA